MNKQEWLTAYMVGCEELEYYKALEVAREEFKICYEEYEINSIDKFCDSNPIYPTNFELYHEFEDEYGFDQSEFIQFLNKPFGYILY